MLWFYLQPFFGNHTQKRETETKHKHMPPEAHPHRSNRRPRPLHATVSAPFLFLPFFCLCKPICSNPPSSEVPSIFVEQCPKPKKPIPQTHSNEPTTPTNPFRKPISQTNLSLFPSISHSFFLLSPSL